MITQIQLKNCQSWEDLTIDLASDKLNVIIAENDTGKSVLFKVLKLIGSPTYYKRDDRKSLIRWGAEKAYLTAVFDDGCIGMVQIASDGVLYCFFNEDGEKSLSYEPPERMLREFGMLVGKDSDYIANIIDADQDLMLVNSNLSNNFELLKLIVVCEELDEFILRVKELEDEEIMRIQQLNMQVTNLECELEQIGDVDLPLLQHSVSRAEAAYRVLRGIVSLEKVTNRIDKVKWIDFEKLEQVLNVAQKTAQAEQCVNQIQVSKEPDSRLENVYETLNSLSKVKGLADCMQVAEEVSQNLETVFTIVQSLSKAKSIVEQLRVLAEPDSRTENALSVLSSLQDVSRLVDSLTGLQSMQKNSSRQIKELEEQFYQAGQVVQCPVYGEVVFDGKECVASNN